MYINLSRKKQDTITIYETQLQSLKDGVNQASNELRKLDNQYVPKPADHDDTSPKISNYLNLYQVKIKIQPVVIQVGFFSFKLYFFNHYY